MLALIFPLVIPYGFPEVQAKPKHEFFRWVEQMNYQSQNQSNYTVPLLFSGVFSSTDGDTIKNLDPPNK